MTEHFSFCVRVCVWARLHIVTCVLAHACVTVLESRREIGKGVSEDMHMEAWL